MAKRKPAPERSTLQRGRTLAYSKREKPETKLETEPEPEPEIKPEIEPEIEPETTPKTTPETEAKASEIATTEPPPPKAAPWPAATPAVPMPVAVEDPTHLPAPREIPTGDPTAPALPPGRVPPGDSRSLRRGIEFALIYRVQTAVITRTGTVGTLGVWRVVDYPTSASASNAYAKECSRFVTDGFSDYRD
jgi:hypothetical protein